MNLKRLLKNLQRMQKQLNEVVDILNDPSNRLVHTIHVEIICKCSCSFIVEANIAYPTKMFTQKFDPYSEVFIDTVKVIKREFCTAHCVQPGLASQAAEYIVAEHLDDLIPTDYEKLLDITKMTLKDVDLDSAFDF